MVISILCVDKNYGIGKNNGLLFRLPKDMDFFKEQTNGHIVYMGEKTLLSFPNSKPLKNRVNVVLSQDETHNYEGCINFHNFEDFIKNIQEKGRISDVYIIGGASIYKQTLPYVDRVLLTKVEADGGATLFFENLDNDPDFQCVYESEPIQDGKYKIRFTTYIKKSN